MPKVPQLTCSDVVVVECGVMWCGVLFGCSTIILSVIRCTVLLSHALLPLLLLLPIIHLSPSNRHSSPLWRFLLSSPPCLSVTRHSEFETTLNGVTVQDVRLLVEAMNFVDENMTACVGVTAPTPPPGKMMRPSVIRYAALLFNFVCCVVFQ
jgi:hypothetical protein